MQKYKLFQTIYIVAFFSILGSCKKFVTVELPGSRIAGELVFENDITATAAVTGLYNFMRGDQGIFSNGLFGSIMYLAGHSSDELNRLAEDPDYIEFQENELRPANAKIFPLWGSMYQPIYQSNAVIKGIEKSVGMTESAKKQLGAEARFVRAFCDFYLVNTFGDVPLVTGTDYEINSRLPRSATADVYQQIIDDLNYAVDNLTIEDIGFEKARPNKYAAIALLARVYLYLENWEMAADLATSIIDIPQFGLPTLESVFLKNSSEAIWQMEAAIDIDGNGRVGEAAVFEPGNIQSSSILNQQVIDAFEPGDNRKNIWTATTDGFTYPSKYKQFQFSALTEYSMVIRLAEIYLIRAEARIQLDKIEEGIDDLNTIRSRARSIPSTEIPNPLPAVSSLLSKADALLALEHERRVELFTEWGHRWFDLKRWNKATDVLMPIKPNWSQTDELYPLPQQEMDRNPFLTPQNPGYSN